MAAAARRLQTMVPGATTAVAAAARRLQTMVPGASTAAAATARRFQTMVPEASTTAAAATARHLQLPHKEIRTVFGLPRPSYNRLQQRSMCSSSSSDKDGLIDPRNVKDLEHRILVLETVCNFYKKFQWLLVVPAVGLLMSVPSAIEAVYGVYKVKKEQMKTAKKLSNLESRIEYLEGKMN